MKLFLVGNLIFFIGVVHSFPFPHHTGHDFPPFAPFPPGDDFFGEERTLSGISSLHDEGFDGFRKFGIGCSENSGFPEEPDIFGSEDGFHREGHEGGGGPPFMMGDGFDASNSAGANAESGTEHGSHFLGSGIGGAFGSAGATANAVAGANAGTNGAHSTAQAKSETFTNGNGAFSSSSSVASSAT